MAIQLIFISWIATKITTQRRAIFLFILEQETLLTNHSALFLRFRKSSTSQISPAWCNTFDKKKKKSKLRIASARWFLFTSVEYPQCLRRVKICFSPRHCSGLFFIVSSLNDWRTKWKCLFTVLIIMPRFVSKEMYVLYCRVTIISIIMSFYFQTIFSFSIQLHTKPFLDFYLDYYYICYLFI